MTRSLRRSAKAVPLQFSRDKPDAMWFSNGRYNSYGEFLKQRFGTRIHKIPVHAGFTCPNRDGSVALGGCTYCNIDSYTPEGARARLSVKEQIENSISYLRGRFRSAAFIAYFQPYSNTYASLEHLAELYEQALSHPEIVGLAVGTRPDCVDDAKLDYLQQLARDYFVTIEYGVESAHDETLRLINRGHDFACTEKAIRETAARGIHVCGHVIYGFPNESREQMLATTATVSALPLDFIKLHNLHIVRYTELARQFKQEPFPVFDFGDWVEFVCTVIERLNPDFQIERMYGDAPKELLIEPQWCRDKSPAEVIYAVQQRLQALDTHQGKYFAGIAVGAGSE